MEPIVRPRPREALAARLADHSARLGIVGMGYVGLPTAVAYARAGYTVTGVDISLERRTALSEGHSYVEGVADAELREVMRSGRLRVVESLDAAGDLDVVDICVPTPLDKSREPDISAIVAVIKQVRSHLRPGQLVLLTSTTYPGTTVEVVQPELEADGLVAGRDFFLAFTPERIDPGNPTFNLHNTPKVVGGLTPACTALATALVGTITDTVVPLSDPTTAEMTKLLENTFRSVNIGLANEVAIMCHRLGINVWQVIEAAASKPYGFTPFYPGPGLGGHCIPVDPSYLAWKLRRLNYTARYIDLANEINRHMPEYVVGRAGELLNAQRTSVNGARVHLVGIAYKRDVGDLRESPALDILDLLRKQGADVTFSDPHVQRAKLDEGDDVVATPATAELLHRQDLVIICTDHTNSPWQLIQDNARLVFDTRGTRHGQGRPGWHQL
jgi:UDP-N-acetyl-D-glucosamine dehydrogenase